MTAGFVEKWNVKKGKAVLKKVEEKYKPKKVSTYVENGLRITVYESRSCES